MDLKRILRQRLPVIVIGAALLAAVLLLVTRPDTPTRPRPERAWAVELIDVNRQSLRPSLAVYGRVESPQDAELSASLEADVVQIDIQEGSVVEADQVLLVLDARDVKLELMQREADVADSRAELRLAQKRLTRNQQVLASENKLLALAQKNSDRAATLFKQQRELEQADAAQPDAVMNRHLIAAMRHVLCARDLCPLLPAPHTRIAFYVDALATADPRSAYIERAKILAPVDPQLWYLCGLQELADNQPHQAWKSWRRSLELSDRFLTRILDRAATVLSPDEILTIILPDQPAILLAAALYLYPEPAASLQRQPLLEKALALCGNQLGPLDPESWHTKATLHRQLAQPTEAIDAYQSALGHDPRQVQWRYELATLLHEQEQRQAARRELEIIRSQNPNHVEASQLLEVLAREAAEGKL